MINRVLYLILIFTLLSCKDRKTLSEQKDLLLGDWVRISYQENQMSPFGMQVGFNFLSDDTYEDKLGFFNFDKEYVKYDGNLGKYQIIGDTIKMSVTGKWYSRTVYKLTKDTLIFGTKDDNVIFLKKEYDTIDIPEFDEIVVSSYANGNILLSKNENVYFSKPDNDKVHYKASISQKDFRRIVTQFKKADYINLRSNYNASSSEDKICAVTFLKNKKNLNSITFYASSASPEFKSAYTQLIYIPQTLSTVPDSVPKYLDLKSLEFKNDNTRLELNSSEVYYLLNLIKNGKEGRYHFKEEYNLTSKNEYVNKITTDGRYYKFYLKDNSNKVIDIEMNFLEGNNFSNTFEKMNNTI